MIRCTEQYNNKCLKCKKVEYRMVLIGAFYMCPSCYINEFGHGTIEFESNSTEGKIYYDWLQVYKDYYSVEI